MSPRGEPHPWRARARTAQGGVTLGPEQGELRADFSHLGTVNNLGNLYKEQGKRDEAEKMYQRALEGYEKALGAKHPSTLGTVNNLGRLYVNNVHPWKRDEAEKLHKRYRPARQGNERHGMKNPLHR